MASSKGSDPKTTTRYVTASGKIPLLSAVDYKEALSLFE